MTDEVTERTEKWFLDRGLPHFIADYDAATDIWTRALPALTLLFLVELVALAPNRNFPLWLDVLVVAVIFALAIGGLGARQPARAAAARSHARTTSDRSRSPRSYSSLRSSRSCSAGRFARRCSPTIANVVLLGAHLPRRRRTALIPMTAWGLGPADPPARGGRLARSHARCRCSRCSSRSCSSRMRCGRPRACSTARRTGSRCCLFPLVGVLFLVSRDSRATSAS